TPAEAGGRDGALRRALATPQGAWRFRVSLDEIDPHFVDMLVAYEDRRFRRHFGVDPAALARAAVQLVANGRIVSGGSTITMQLARLTEPRNARSLMAKLRQLVTGAPGGRRVAQG